MMLSSLLQILSILTILNLCQGQVELDLPDVAANSLPSQPSEIAKPLRICNPEDELSNSYCKCSDQVVTCDFTKYTYNSTMSLSSSNNNITNATSEVRTPESDNIELTVYGYQFPPTTSRFCICNTPSNLHLTFTKNQFLPFSTNKIQRFDLFNLTGITHFMGGFSINFNGDLYIANVSRIPEIHAFEFGRGNDKPIQNVQDLDCCSPIKLNQSHAKPLLFIENSTIDLIKTRGLDAEHLWKTVVLKSNTLNRVEEEGIILDYTGSDIAILKGKFKNLSSSRSLVFKDSNNVFLVKNEFRHSQRVDSAFFSSISTLTNSNVVLLDNLFWNEIYMNVDARHVVSWFNLFDLWDNETFAPMKHTLFSTMTTQENNGIGAMDRAISIKYNLVSWPRFSNSSIEFGDDTKLDLSDNILGTCNCSTFLIKDKMLRPEMNWCYTGRVGRADGKCSIRLDSALKKCKESESVDFEKLCRDKKISIPRFPGVGTNLTEEVEEMRINSDFITRIVEDFHSSFGINRIAKLKGILASKNDNHDYDQNEESTPVSMKEKEISKKGSVVLPIVVTMMVMVFIFVVGVFLYKKKCRFFNRSGHAELIDENQSAMI